MKRLFLLAACLLAALPAAAQAPRTFHQAELDALLAPVALYPDSVLDQVLVAATYPEQVEEAAAWRRANPHLQGDEAVDAASTYGWHPAVAALTGIPDVLERMAASPQWLRDLGDAYLDQEPHVLETVQQLRRRAQASGHLQSDSAQHVVQHGSTIVVQPAYQEVVYVRYYDPLVVFGAWWWASHRPVYWRPWHAHPVRYHWTHHHRRVVHARHHVHRPRPHRPALVHRSAPTHRAANVQRSAPSPAARMQAEQTARFIERQRAARQAQPQHHQRSPASRPHVRVPESQRQPIVSSTRPAPVARPAPQVVRPAPAAAMPAPRAFTGNRGYAPPRQGAQQHGRRGAPPRK